MDIKKVKRNEVEGLEIFIELQNPTVSASGKTLVVASTHGNAATSVVINGKPVMVGVNAFIGK